MKKLLIISFFALLICFFSACKKERALTEVKGSWTLVYTIPNVEGLFSGREIFATSTGLIGAGVGIGPGENITYSANYGVNWTVDFASTASWPGSAVFLDAMNNARLVTYSQPDSTFYVSTTGGLSWAVLNHPAVILDSASNMQFVGVSGSNLFAISYSSDSLNGNVTSGYLLRSTNAGNSWNTVSNNALIAANIAVIGGYASSSIQIQGLYNMLFINTGSGNLFSTDNGNTWALQVPSVAEVFIEGMAAKYLIGYGPNSNFIYRSTDTAKTWLPYSLPNLPGGNSLGSCYGFDSIVIVSGSLGNANSMICQNVTKGVWYFCDTGLQFVSGTFFTDNQYVYLVYENLLLSGALNLYRRPKSDFATL